MPDVFAHQDNNFFSDLIQIKPATPKISDQRNSNMLM